MVLEELSHMGEARLPLFLVRADILTLTPKCIPQTICLPRNLKKKKVLEKKKKTEERAAIGGQSVKLSSPFHLNYSCSGRFRADASFLLGEAKG